MNRIFASLIMLTVIFSALSLANVTVKNDASSISDVSGTTSNSGMLVGNDVDEHGCKPSAGYRWCPALNQCARIWEHSECKPAVEPTAAASCVDDALKSELNYLFAKLKEAEQNNDTETYMGIKNKIQDITKEMAVRNSACQVTVQMNLSSSSSSTPLVNKIGFCNDLESLKIKIAYYDNLLGNPDNLSTSGMKEDEIKSKLSELHLMLNEREASCNNLTRANLGILVSQAVKNKEGGANDIVAYYKLRLSDIVSSNQDPSVQIQSLKQLRNEIDSLIEDLIRKQNSISSEDLSQLVNEIKVKPDSIVADNFSIDATNRTMTLKVGENKAEIRNNGKSVEFISENVSANASEITVGNGTARIGNASIKITPHEAASKIKLNPKNVELVNSNGIVSYEITADEDRKLFGLFLVKVEKHVSVNGINGSIISESTPFWSFLTTAVQ